jgi:hypothetical protein
LWKCTLHSSKMMIYMWNFWDSCRWCTQTSLMPELRFLSYATQDWINTQLNLLAELPHAF